MDTRKVQKGRAGALGGGAGLVEPWPVVGAGHDVGARLLVVPRSLALSFALFVFTMAFA